MNNKSSFILSLVAIVLVILLAIVQFTGKKQSTPKTTTNAGEAVSIAYINLDTLLNNYDLYNSLMIDFMKKQQNYEKQLQSKMMSLQQRSMSLQQQYNQGLITSLTYQQKAQKLQQEQQTIQQWYQQKSQELQQDQQMITMRVMDSLNNAVNEFNKDQRYDFILTKDALFYGNPDANITDTLITLMNSKLDLNMNK